eukprot:Plantae.Rhodophyta-Rhodochaete_pulchella.ctg17020.p3 GENE.Plantae.Rhodophyta-Rhodochaete_pulchella.ctg17020~~Plantae.Rhodophyta-Rhodochaete_pulchella.ctg17020.p3  ORF type:complete len:130 (-),score=35.56 Plantae.Rhodophyta-Rhodochaete_pulchella.ctg17020:952-1341(-)
MAAEERKGLWDAPEKLFDARTVDAKSVTGSTAGAGSGDFHVYRAQRRKELARVAELEAEAAKVDETQRFRREAEERRKKEEERTEKRRKKRKRRQEQRSKNAKRAEGSRKDAGFDDDDDELREEGDGAD